MWLKLFFTGGMFVSKMRNKTAASLTDASLVPVDQYYVHEMRAQYGEPVAHLFAFSRHFIRMLHIPAIVGMLLVILNEAVLTNNSDRALVRVAFGSVMSIIWGTLFLTQWERELSGYNFQWHPDAQDTFKEAEYPNENFQGELVPSKITGDLEPAYPNWKRIPAQILRIILI